MLWFFWTLPVLLQRWCSTCMVCVYTHWHKGKTEKGQSPEYSKIFGKNTIFDEHPVCHVFYSINVTNSVCTTSNQQQYTVRAVITKECMIVVWKLYISHRVSLKLLYEIYVFQIESIKEWWILMQASAWTLQPTLSSERKYREINKCADRS